jgi:cell division protein FtsI (penicillin-binding protein 3)
MVVCGSIQIALTGTLTANLGELAQRVQSHPHARFLYLARQINPEQAEWIDKSSRR